MDVFDLVAKISIDDTEYERGLNNASSKNEGLSASTIAMGNLMAQAFTTVINKVVEYGQKVVEVGAEQEQALAKVGTIMNTDIANGGMALESMSAGIKNLSGEMGISVTELSDSVYNVISATGDTQNALSLAEKASKLATAGFTDTGSAVGVLTTAMNAYHLSAEEAEHISDSLIQVQNLGVTTVGELSSSMGKAIASASAYGVNLENLESAYISITKAGINTAEGTTYISSMLKELGDSGSSVSGILQEQTGKSFDQLLAEGKSLGDALNILNESVDGDATALMNLWSSAEAGKASSAIIGQGIEQFNSNLQSLQETTGTTQTAYETMADTFTHKTEVMKTKMENFGADIFDNISGGLTGGLDIVMSIMDDFSYQMENSGATTGTEYVLAFIENLFYEIQDNASYIVSQGAEVVKSFLQGLTDKLPDIVTEGILIIEELVASIGRTLPELIPVALDAINTLVESLIDNIDLIINAGIELLLGLVDGIVEALPKLLDEAPVIITKMVEAIVRNLPKIIEAGLHLILSLAEGLIKAIPRLVTQIPTIIKAIVQGVKNGVSSIKESGKYLIEGLWEGIKDRWERLKESVLGLGKNLVKSVNNIFGIHSPSTVFKQIGSYMVAGLEEGTDGMFSDKGLHATVSADVKGETGTEEVKSNGFAIDYEQLGASVANALAGFSINMDGKTVAQLLAGNINYQLGVLNARRV